MPSAGGGVRLLPNDSRSRPPRTLAASEDRLVRGALAHAPGYSPRARATVVGHDQAHRAAAGQRDPVSAPMTDWPRIAWLLQRAIEFEKAYHALLRPRQLI